MPLLAVVATIAALVQPPVTDTAKARANAVAAERRFLKRWREAWLDGEQDRQPFPPGGRYAVASSSSRRAQRPSEDSYVPPGAARQLAAVHCHPEEAGGSGFSATRNRIGSETSWHGACPAWTTNSTPKVDVAASIDSALTPDRRARIRAARRALLATLDSAARLLPNDRFLVEQRVRFLVDDGALDSALAVAHACGVGASTCASLAGYVLAKQGRAYEADSAFVAAHVGMTDDARCAWDDVRELIDERDRAAYANLSCAARDSANARFWWVSRPLFGDAANERRVEHYARKVYVALHSALENDEQHDWTLTHAADALATMYARYGVPTYVRWGGAWTDRGHDGFLMYHASPTSAPYTAAEYSTGRAHVVPRWHAIAQPTLAASDDWELAPPHANAWELWWPTEHFLRRGGALVALPQGQVATLRRARGTLLAVSTVAPTDSSGVAAMCVSWHPDSIMQIAQGGVARDGRLVLTGQAGTQPALVGVELPLGGGTVARSRFGVSMPPALVGMAPDESAVSMPVLFDAPSDAEASEDPDSVIASMLPSTRVASRAGSRRVGVYWETYGIAPGDSVDVQVRAVRVGTADESGVAVRWREPRPDHVITLVEAPRPIVARSVVLELSRLASGRYWLEVSVARPGSAAVTARKAITLE